MCERAVLALLSLAVIIIPLTLGELVMNIFDRVREHREKSRVVQYYTVNQHYYRNYFRNPL